MDNSSRLQQFGAALPLLERWSKLEKVFRLASVQERDVFMSRRRATKVSANNYQYLIQYIHTYLIFKPSKLITDELSTGRYNWYIFMYVIRSLFILRVLCILCFMFVRSKSCPLRIRFYTYVHSLRTFRRHVYMYIYLYIYMYIRTYVNLFTTHQVRIYVGSG